MSRIVHLCLNGPVTDGWNYQDNLLTKYQRKNGHEVFLITSQWIWNDKGKLVKDERKQYINADGVEVIRLPLRGKDNVEKKFKLFSGLTAALETSDADILFVHGVGSLENRAIVRYLKKHPDVTVYADNHSDESNSGTNWLSKNILHRVIWRFFARRLIPYVRKFYGVLPARVDWLTEMYGIPEEKCDLLVMGADDEKIEAAAKENAKQLIRTQFHILPDDFLIMTGGKIDAWKTQTLLLMEAVRSIPNEKVKLIVFGSVTSDLMGKVKAMSDGQKVQYIGWVPAEESYRYWMAADLAVFPGRHSVFWEQVAGMGIPMICKYWKGTTHIDIGGNVRFLYQDSEEEIQNQIVSLLNCPEEYEEMLMKAQGDGEKIFSYREISKRAIEE